MNVYEYILIWSSVQKKDYLWDHFYVFKRLQDGLERMGIFFKIFLVCPVHKKSPADFTIDKFGTEGFLRERSYCLIDIL